MIQLQPTPKAMMSGHVRHPGTPFQVVLLTGIPAEYRSAIFTHSPEQVETAKRVTAEVQAKYFDPKGQKIVTTIEPATAWYDAEDYHQEYLFKNPNGYQCATHRLWW
jgi:peptide-methionine (S)-S-oxide reductase